jgi:hypothetical protein
MVEPGKVFTFLESTTSETKNGFLLIEVFRKLFNPQNNGHQGSILGGHFLYCRGCRDFVFKPNSFSTNKIGG